MISRRTCWTKHWSLTTLREKLMKISPKVVRHPKHKTFQLAEGSITAPDAFQVLCGHEFQMKKLRSSRRPVKNGESVARRRSRVGGSRPKWEIPDEPVPQLNGIVTLRKHM